MKNKIRKEYMFLGGLMLLALVIVGMFVFNKSYALGEEDKININCDNEVVTSGDEITCSITGTVSSYQVSSLESQVSLSENLEFVSFTVDDTVENEDDMWQGNGEDGNIQLFVANNKSETFAIGELKVKVKENSVLTTESITLENIVFYDELFEEHIIDSVSVDVDSEYLNINNLDVLKDEKIIYNLEVSDTYTELLENIDTSGTVTILDKNNNIVDQNSDLKTGDVIKVKLKNATEEYKISVLGDVTGDGKVSFSDVTTLYQYYNATKDIVREEEIDSTTTTVNLQKSQAVVYESYSFDEEKGVFNLTGTNVSYYMLDESEFTSLSGMVGRGSLKYVCEDFNSSSCTKMYELTSIAYNNGSESSTLTYIKHNVGEFDIDSKYALTLEKVFAGDLVSNGIISFGDVTTLYQYYNTIKNDYKEEVIDSTTTTVNLQKSQSVVYESYNFDEKEGIFNLTGTNMSYYMLDESEFTSLSGMIGRGTLKYVCEDFNSSSCTKMYELTSIAYNNGSESSTLTYIVHSVK